MRLAIYLEEIFAPELPNEVVPQFVTVADIVDYFSRRYFRDFQSPLPAVAIATYTAAGDQAAGLTELMRESPTCAHREKSGRKSR